MISQPIASSAGNVPPPDTAGVVRRFFSALNPMLSLPIARNRFPALLLAAALMAGCEDPGTGTLDPRGNAPFLESARVSPDSVNLGRVIPGPSGLPIVVTATVRLTDRDADGRVSAAVDVFAPSDDSLVTSLPLRDDGGPPDAAAGDGVFSARISFTVTESDAGRYRVRFSASDELGLRSNTLEQPLVLARGTPNSPPELSALVAPDTVTLPSSGSLLVTMSVAVADADGYGDIRDVYFRNLDSSDPSRRFFLKDDGGTGVPTSGDEVAGDGRFSIIIQLPSTAARRDYRFEFQATDVEGDASQPLLHVLTVK